ncbi:uncharacterized protein LOC131997373 [Stomoxys calcitrans]|uniref:uncharacterized protein LOC131997373 n=1 Tax=Stomoxys calcitrans TaxID=35570 RepID=UPI0027E32970|nr:uncharacterized protein LOC131997373 [Stomoxys calcitrans]
MHTNQWNLRQQGNIDYKEHSASNEDLDFFDSSDTKMLEMENILKPMVNLESEVISLREARQTSIDVHRPGVHRHIFCTRTHTPTKMSFCVCNRMSLLTRRRTILCTIIGYKSKNGQIVTNK